MAYRMIRTFICIFLSFSLATSAFAQENDDGQQKKGGPRKQLAVIVFAGLGGAVLGLSTLSFYGRPQDYLANIAVGFALGIIGGTIFATYKAAAKPKEFYGIYPDRLPDEGLLLSKDDFAKVEQSPMLNMSWNF